MNQAIAGSWHLLGFIYVERLPAGSLQRTPHHGVLVLHVDASHAAAHLRLVGFPDRLVGGSRLQADVRGQLLLVIFFRQ